MKRYNNEIFMDMAVYDGCTTYALRLAKDEGESVAVSIAGVFKETDTDFSMTIYNPCTGSISESCRSVFDSEQIVILPAEEVFMDAAEATEVKYTKTVKKGQHSSAFQEALGIPCDGYNSLKISQNDLSEIIDLLRDGIYLIRLD